MTVPLLSRYYSPVCFEKLSRIEVLRKFQDSILQTEYCFYVICATDLTSNEDVVLRTLLLESGEHSAHSSSQLPLPGQSTDYVVEVGPSMAFVSPFSTNVVSACHNAGLRSVVRVELSTRYACRFRSADEYSSFLRVAFDPMLERVYGSALSLSDFCSGADNDAASVLRVPLDAMEEYGRANALGFDADDLSYYREMYADLGRDPTDVELFDLAQSNSEHSRHWFFKGRLDLDGVESDQSLLDMVIATQQGSRTNANNVIAFSDNSSAIRGFEVEAIVPSDPTTASLMLRRRSLRHIVYTAETHNFPTGVCPFPGAATGTGGRIRDVQATGRGAHVVAGISAYAFGNVHIPGYELPWEDKTLEYPAAFASPLDVVIQASNGASDYGNKFGEPVLCGFSRSFGMVLPNGERREYVKPIMFSGGLGQVEGKWTEKHQPQEGWKLVKIGGPVYRIGVGGGAASSSDVQGASARDFNAVQRGDAEMGQKLNRVVRGCVESLCNPIASIHDQGAGGNGNVLKELVEGHGADVYMDRFTLGDATLTPLELWGAEYQESNAILVANDPENLKVLDGICKRERCDYNVVGSVRNDNRIKLHTDSDMAVDLKLDWALGKRKPKCFTLKRADIELQPLVLPQGQSLHFILDRVLRLPSVASKRYLTNKVDRSVSGLVAQQQCVGPLHTPLADCGVTALSFFDNVGSAVAVGEQPIKMLGDPAAGARMSVAEALTNLVFAPITALEDVKCSANWMWPCKGQSEEGARLLHACMAMCSIMEKLGVAVDGGKDSLSMTACTQRGDLVKAPGTLVVTAYAPCVDITKTVTPDLKGGILLHVSFGAPQARLGGSAVAQCFSQIGDCAPDLDDAEGFRSAFNVIQSCVKDSLLSAGHDVSDGGLAVCVLEMAFAGNCGLQLNLDADTTTEDLFAEECGVVVEVTENNLGIVSERLQSKGIVFKLIGKSLKDPQIIIKKESELLLEGTVHDLRDIWEATSFAFEMQQCSPDCVKQERAALLSGAEVHFSVSSTLQARLTRLNEFHPQIVPRVAVVREEGSNGDREMAAAFMSAGFDVLDVTMTDLVERGDILRSVRGMAFVGGFSYADVLGAAKGWASAVRFNARIQAQFGEFYERSDTFSLGVCNGCQLMVRLGIVGRLEGTESNEQTGVSLERNASGRFESRFSAVRIQESNAIMLRGMQGSVLGVWVSNGEGRFQFNKSDETSRFFVENGLAPLCYVDCGSKAACGTMAYPHNPSGSAEGIAALSSPCGRHLAMMPHPERSFRAWQWPYMNDEVQRLGLKGQDSPWMAMFHNAYEWCVKG